MTTAYPLSWPVNWPRTPASKREPARFHGTTATRLEGGGIWRQKTDLSISAAVKRLWGELQRLGVPDASIVLSTNVQLRLDGLPRSDQRRIDDPGAAVYFKLKGKDRVLACDRWMTVADNIAAVAKHIEAIRGIERWGVGTIEQAFMGYAALPAPGMASKRPWRAVLNVGATITLAEAESAYRRRLSEAHPDRGGTHEQATELNAAIAEAREALSA